MIGSGENLDNVEITVPLVTALIVEQFPHLADLRVRPVARSGWDNRTFHLGDDLLARLPSAARYAPQVEKEQRWLPRLAPHLPCEIPEPVAMGQPSHGYPWAWSVYRWIEGETAGSLRVMDRGQFASDAAEFLRALHRIDTAGGPAPGAHNFHRGAHPSVYDAETRAAISRLISRLGKAIDGGAALRIWERAMATTEETSPNVSSVWVHGDFAPDNILVRQGRLTAVIDFGCLGVGDPACDLTLAWTLFEGESRRAFRAGLPLGPAIWARARGWALWKALITLAALEDTSGARATEQQRIIARILSDDS